jgi:hypothetical protein
MNLLPEDFDVRQWRALLRVSFKIMQRQQSHLSMGKQSRMSNLWMGVLFYGIMGFVFAGAAAAATSAGTAAFILACLISVFISTLVLLEFGSTIVSPDDIAVLSMRPISSRTYFAARISAVGVMVLLYATAMSGPAVVAFAWRFGVHVGLAWLLAAISGSLAAALLMIVIYTGALRHISPTKIRTVMGYVQLVLSFTIYGGYAILSEKLVVLMGAAGLPAFAPLLPQAWFASIVALAAGETSTTHWLGLALSITLLGGLIAAVGGRISLGYAEASAAAVTEGSEKRKKGKASGLGVLRLLRHHEDRAIALLLLRQFRYDVKFKMSVLTIIPLTFLYLYQGMQRGDGIVDPFISTGGFGPSVLLYVAVILFPVILKNEIVRSDMYQASWVFYASPVLRGELILSVRRVITVLFVLPYLGLLTLIFFYFFRHPGHVLQHMIVLYLASNLFLQVLFIITPQLPFSRPRVVGERVAAITVTMIAGPIFFLATMGLFTYFLYPSFWLYAAGTSVMIAINMLLRSLLSKRAMKAGEELEYGW